MTTNTRRVFYLNRPAHPVFNEILGGRPDVQLDRLVNDSPDEIAEPVLARAHVYQIGATRDELALKYHGTADLLARTPNLLAVSSNGAGYDTVDVAACTQAGVAVVNQTGGNKEGVAEHVLAMMLVLSKRIMETDRFMRRAPNIPRVAFMGHNVEGRTIGIVGIGNIGSRVAELCRGLFRMRVLAYDPYLNSETVTARGAEKVALDQLLREADYVSINCPRTAETRGMIGAREYALMKPEAYFITTARGGIHDEVALADALANGRLAGAGLDVWEKEPPDPSHPLLQLDNVLVSPHTAGVTHESRHNMGRFAAEQILEILDGKRPKRLVNPEVWPRYRERFAQILGFVPEG
ncbi:MAG TPA: hydroxyacid dehydrogenase [Acetobacteraceae bacterium]|nr:hydroxyacid dehydrogenase [Acetobacteraceae bacterium]